MLRIIEQLFVKAEIDILVARPEEGQDFRSLHVQACVIDGESFEINKLNQNIVKIYEGFSCPILVLGADIPINQPYVAPISVETPPHEIRRIVENRIEIYGQKADKFKKLTTLESLVFNEIIKGVSDKEIAHHYNLPLYKVKYHLRCLYKKIGVTNRTQAALIGRDIKS